MTIQKVFEKQYGSEVDDKEVNDTVAEEQKNMVIATTCSYHVQE